ncbi:MAG: hypothetical protein ABSF83_07800 [Nitrososphaerales archaeon]|jgi:hypothetical protein
MRSVFVPWSVAFAEGERLLDDLSRYTRVDCVELLDFTSQIERPDRGRPNRPASRVLPTSGGLEMPLVRRDEFAAALRFMDSARSRGFKVACNLVPLWLGTRRLGHSSLVDANGRRIPGPGDLPTYGCPNDPQTLRHAEFMVREVVRAWPDLDVMELNHMEYPNILLWAYPRVDLESLFACFCGSCERAARDMGLDFAGMRRDARSLLELASHRARGPLVANADDLVNLFLQRPGLAEWLRFRMDSMSRFTRALIAAGREASREHNRGLRLGLQFQLPSMSPLLGTDFSSLSSDLDFLVPKFFDYLPGSVIPLVARELSSRTGLEEEGLRRTIREAFDLGRGPARYKPCAAYPKISHTILYSNSFDCSIFGRQMRYLDRLRGRSEIVPAILECNRDKAGLRRKVQALSREGFDGFFLWSWEEGLTSEHLRSLQGIL